jgi:hypothetical protein
MPFLIPYNSKIPLEISSEMNRVTNNQCVLVKKTYKVGYSTKQNCHLNVMSYVDKFGGDIIGGWLLQRNPKLIKAGIWLWVFHSVWKKDGNCFYDLTEDTVSKKPYSTFTPDIRLFNLKDGTTYNDIVILSKKYDKNLFCLKTNLNIASRKIYWILNNLSRVREVNHSSTQDGICRLVNSGYPQNIELLSKKYGIEPEDSMMKKLQIANSDSNVLFEFSI